MMGFHITYDVPIRKYDFIKAETQKEAREIFLEELAERDDVLDINKKHVKIRNIFYF
jgi:hypothetical protein